MRLFIYYFLPILFFTIYTSFQCLANELGAFGNSGIGDESLLAIANEKPKDRKLTAEDYTGLSEIYFLKGAYDSMAWSLHKAKSLIRNQDSPELTSIYLQLSTRFHYSNNFDSLDYYLRLALKSIDENSPLYPQYLLIEGLKSQYNLNYINSIESILTAIKLLEANGEKKSLAIAYNNLAFNYRELGDYNTHLKYLLEAVAINQELGSSSHLVMNYNNLGIYYKEIDSLEVALRYYDRAYQELLKIDGPLVLAQNLTNRANIYEKLGDYELAEKLFLECEEISEANGIFFGKMLSSLNLGNLYRIQGKFNQAEIRLNQALELTQKLKVKKQEAMTLERMSWLARDKGDYKSAFDLQSRYYLLNDSLVNENLKREASELKEKYETGKKENEILRLLEQKLYQQFYMVLMGVGLLGLIVLVQWWKNKHRISREKFLASNQLLKVKEETLHLREKDLLEQIMEKIVLQEHLDSLRDEVKDKNFEGLNQKVRTIQKKQNPWDLMVKKFQLLHPEFISRVTCDFPDLTKNDIEFCSLVRMNLSNKEIAQILRITVESVFTKKYRILKKLNLDKDKDLNSWVQSIKD